jgi:hypothetical protein
MRRLSICGMFLLWLGNLALADRPLNCDENSALCTERYDPITYNGKYTGHDEPSLLFYSNVPGSGNSSIYRLTIPSEPPTPPNQAGSGGTYNFQLHPTFWFGMAMCDNQSAPNPSSTPCTPNSDSNIFENLNPTASDYIGNHPGTAFMEMQFYPPGWVLWPFNTSCDATKWCAALNIDSLSENMNTGQILNATCRAIVSLEPVNFAFITKDGVPLGPPGPVAATLATFTPTGSTLLLMNPGDEILVTLRDTPDGLKVLIEDLTTGESGFMVASAANGFAQVQFDPTGTSCTQNLYDFHPMYATSSEHTRVVWAAHSYNIAFSDEIGHWEYCSDANCSTPQDPDDVPGFCFPSSQSSLIPIGGCTFSDFDFNGVSYQAAWPGTMQAFGQDKKVNPSPVRFSSPKFLPTAGGPPQGYDRVAFETNLPRIEPGCNTQTGANCFNPPPGAQFYPIYTTTGSPNDCEWQLGGANLPGTKDTFGGTSFLEYGSLLQLSYPGPGNTPIFRFNDFRQVLASNPCVSK